MSLVVPRQNAGPKPAGFITVWCKLQKVRAEIYGLQDLMVQATGSLNYDLCVPIPYDVSLGVKLSQPEPPGLAPESVASRRNLAYNIWTEPVVPKKKHPKIVIRRRTRRKKMSHTFFADNKKTAGNEGGEIMFEIPVNNWGFINRDRIAELNEIYDSIRGGYFPKNKGVLRFLNTDFNNLKYIIVGMEPYPTSFTKGCVDVPEATGRSFEVASLESWQQKFKQSSLRNILKTVYLNYTGEAKGLKEIRMEIADKAFPMKQPREWFDSLEKQGVLFLNATLTVEPYRVDSHTKLWSGFMTALISHIEQNQDVEWFLWGSKAQQRVAPYVRHSIQTVHPRVGKFVQQNCFKGKDKVDWRG